MLATPVDAVPEGADLIHEPKWDGWRCIAFHEDDRVYLQSRAGRNLTTYFPDITRAVRTLPPGVVLDGELIVWERGRTNFALLQRRVTGGRGLLRMVNDHPAHYVLFDLLAAADGRPVLDLPLSDRRAQLERLLGGAPAQLTLTPQTTDMGQVSDWLTEWTVATGIEGVVTKRLGSRYQPGRRSGWWKFRKHLTTEAIVAGVTGSLHSPETLLLGRFDRWGRLRYTGRTHPLHTDQRQELGLLVSAAAASASPPRRRGASVAAAVAGIVVWAAGPARGIAVRAGGADNGGGDRGGHGVRTPAMEAPGPIRAGQARHVGVRRAAAARRSRRLLRRTMSPIAVRPVCHD